MTKREPIDSEVRERAAVAYGEGLQIPPAALVLDGFRQWAHSDGFPETGRVDYLAGAIEVEMSPEDLQTHGTVKTAVAAELFARIARQGRGFVFADRTRVTALPIVVSRRTGTTDPSADAACRLALRARSRSVGETASVQ